MLELRAQLRELGRTPGYLVAVLFSLSTGMAACVAVFSIVNTLIFADVPGLADRSTMVRLTWSDGLSLSPADLEPFERHALPSLGPVAAQGDRRVGIVLPAGPVEVPAAFVSQDFFTALGTRPVAGRLLTAADAGGTSAPVVAISETLWRSAFGGEPAAIGRTLTVAGRAFTVVGVTPHGFPGLDLADVGTRQSALPQIFLPLPFAAMWRNTAAHDARFLMAAVRLENGARLAAVRQQVAVVGARLSSDDTGPAPPRSLRTMRMGLRVWDAPAESALVIFVFLFVPLGVLAIGCGNVINLQLARAVERAGELSLRLALGASRGRIALLLSAEIVPLAFAAAVLGWAGAHVLLDSAEALMPLRFALDARAFWFAAAIAGLATAISGAFPAWLAARDVVAAGLRAREGAPAHTRLRQLLVVAQVAGSVALVAIATLAARTLREHAPAATAAARTTLIAEVNLTDVSPDHPRSALFVRSMLGELAAKPAVLSAGFADFFLSGYPIRYRLAGDSIDEHRTAFGGVVSPGWFDATGTPLLSGRTPRTTAAAMSEAVVNEAFVHRAGLNATTALGSRLTVAMNGGEHTVAIVAVAADRRLAAADSPAPMLILPMPLIPPPSLVLTVRAADNDVATQAIRTAATQFDPTVAFARIDTLKARLDESAHDFRGMTTLAAVFAVLALLLASVGLYALMSYTVRRRTREIGIRVAVGAAPRQILSLVVRLALTLVLVGGGLGLAVATPVALEMRSVFFGLSPWSPWTALPTIALLLLVATAATIIPAVRAVHVDPLAALRES